MWGKVVSSIAGLADTAISGRQKIKQAEIDSKVKALSQKSDWESEQARASASSWKDELWTVLFVCIIGACFVPSLQPYVEHGFKVLDTTPNWFQIAIGMSISASFGIKAYTMFKK